MINALSRGPAPTPSPAAEPPSWADQLEAWATLGAAVIALFAAAATIWLLIHQIRETTRARQDASKERADAAADRELARQDREYAAEERRENEMAQARAVILQYSGKVKKVDGELANHLQGSLTNYSNDPILSVEVYFDGVIDEGVEGEKTPSSIGVWIAPVLGPKEAGQFDVVVPRDDLPSDGWTAVLPIVSLQVVFTDVAGRRWRRLDHGSPERIVWTWPA